MASNARQVLSRTESLCPQCLKRISAATVAYGNEVFLEKECERHGAYRTVIWRGEPAFESWVGTKIPPESKLRNADAKLVCPFDCGLCAEHGQRTYTALLEVTNQCDLHCSVCFADSGRSTEPDPDLSVIAQWYRFVISANRGTCNIQLSGGEPTLRKDLPAIIELGVKLGFSFIQVNTNGLRLSRDKDYVSLLKEAGLRSVFLQFDGTEDEIYRSLRGRPLLKQKRIAIEQCADKNIGVVLAPTLVPGVNTHNIGAILELAREMAPAVRGVHFQPISHFGRYPIAIVQNFVRLAGPISRHSCGSRNPVLQARIKLSHWWHFGILDSRLRGNDGFDACPDRSRGLSNPMTKWTLIMAITITAAKED